MTLRNLLIVMALGGLWHGANWTFVVWGILHGTYLAAEHLAGPLIERIPEAVRRSRAVRAVAAIATFHLVCIAWVFFRAKSVSQAVSILGPMLIPNVLRMDFTGPMVVYVIVGALAVIASLIAAGRGLAARVPGWAWGLAAAGMLFLTIVSWGDANEFIYFRF